MRSPSRQYKFPTGRENVPLGKLWRCDGDNSVMRCVIYALHLHYVIMRDRLRRTSQSVRRINANDSLTGKFVHGYARFFLTIIIYGNGLSDEGIIGRNSYYLQIPLCANNIQTE